MMKKNSVKYLFFRRYGKILLGIIISSATLFLSFRTVSPQQIKDILSDVNWVWFFCALVVFLSNNFLKALRWQVLLSGSGRKIGYFAVLASLMLSQMLNFIVPAKLGDLTRIQQIGVLGTGRSFVLGTIVVEKVIDMLAYGVLFIVLLLSIPLPSWIFRTGILFIVTAGFFIIIMYIVINQPDKVQKYTKALVTIFPHKFGSLIQSRLQNALESLNQLRKGRIISFVVILTILLWLTSILVNWLLFISLAIPLGWQAALTILLALQAVISIPSVPGRIGVFEYFCILTLSLFGINQSTALSYGLLLHSMVLLPILVSGTILLAIRVEQPEKNSEV